MNEKSETVFINKCSSMSFNELGEYIEMCFSYLENPQKHLADLQKIPVLRKTYDVLIENLETKLMELEKLVFCKSKLNELKKSELGKTLDTNFTNLEQYYKAIELDKNNIVSEVAQTKRAVEEILTVLLQSLFSEVRTASIFVKSSEPYHKVLEMIYGLSTTNEEVKKIINSYKFRNFEKLFASAFHLNPIDEHLSLSIRDDIPNALLAFRNEFVDAAQNLSEKSFYKFDIKVVIRQLQLYEPLYRKTNKAPLRNKGRERLKRENPQLRFHETNQQHQNIIYFIKIKYDGIQIKIDSKLFDELSETYEKLIRTHNKEPLTNKLNRLFEPIESDYKKKYNARLQRNQKLFDDKLKNLEKIWGEFKETHSVENLILENEIIKNICREKDLQKRFDRLTNLKREWKNFKNKEITTNSDNINELFGKYKLEKEKYINNFIATFNSLIKDTISQIDNEIKKIGQKENTNSYLQSSKESLTDLQSTKERIFADSKQMIVKEIFWDLLPQGEWKTEGLVKTFNSYGWSKDEFDENRLRQIIESLNPSICYVGKEKFQGYVVFGFDWTKKVVLECPKYGNAIYIIEDDWQEITKLSKWEARKLNEVTVIRHNETWFSRLKSNLKNAY